MCVICTRCTYTRISAGGSANKYYCKLYSVGPVGRHTATRRRPDGPEGAARNPLQIPRTRAVRDARPPPRPPRRQVTAARHCSYTRGRLHARVTAYRYGPAESRFAKRAIFFQWLSDLTIFFITIKSLWHDHTLSERIILRFTINRVFIALKLKYIVCFQTINRRWTVGQPSFSSSRMAIGVSDFHQKTNGEPLT